jgi:Mce-associated membrane protein
MARNRPIAGQRARSRVMDARPAPAAASPTPAPTQVLDRPATRKEHAGGASGLSRLLAGLLALALVALVALGLVAYRVRADDRVETAREQALAAAQDHAVTILSYDYRHLGADFAAARKTLTGKFARDYQATTSTVVRPGAEQVHAIVKAEVAAGSVVNATANRVVVLLFVNQTTTSTRLDGPKVDLNRVRLTLVKVNGQWLVSNVDAL